MLFTVLRGTCPDVQRDVTVLSWLMSVVRNACLRMLKSFRRSRPLLLEGPAVESDLVTDLSPEKLLERWQLIDEVHGAIAALPNIYRQVLLLRDIDGQSGEQVAQRLRLSESAMKTRLHRARQMMRDYLAKNEPRQLGVHYVR